MQCDGANRVRVSSARTHTCHMEDLALQTDLINWDEHYFLHELQIVHDGESWLKIF